MKSNADLKSLDPLLSKTDGDPMSLSFCGCFAGNIKPSLWRRGEIVEKETTAIAQEKRANGASISSTAVFDFYPLKSCWPELIYLAISDARDRKSLALSAG